LAAQSQFRFCQDRQGRSSIVVILVEHWHDIYRRANHRHAMPDRLVHDARRSRSKAKTFEKLLPSVTSQLAEVGASIEIAGRL
jgi:hypothetical protein